MVRMTVLAAALAAAGCATPFQRVEPAEFSPHGRFAPTMGREQAFLECKIVAEQAGRMAAASGAPGTLPQLYGVPPGVVRAVLSTQETCMASKGYRWDTPR